MLRIVKPYFYCIAFFACILLSAHAFAQPQARGFGNAAPAATSANTGRTVALVVGVSDYPYVVPLNYAAEDALLMNDFLQSKAGGSVEPANIRLLLNEEATLQNVVIRGISWLENTIKPTKGDRVIIYLAGHGDAVDASEAYFLCYNVNPAGDKNNYQVTGALDIGKLKSRISKFSAAGAEVVLIMDACRSGDLPGVRTGITNPFESVIERKAGETLMLSASANQLAVEDRRWGRGHGVFTWNLIQGLSGKADENGDGSIDFYEIEQYTKAKVRKETQAMGRMQVPQFAAAPSGGGALGRVDNAFLNKLSTEALSSVSVSESIAQARTAAESSWFTDSALYAGFNEIKKLVRQNKYLGEGSAEPIYMRLTEQFSAEQIEPVRLYYMSALASKGFEAINQELLVNIGLTIPSQFYHRRLSYLNKAYVLQRKQDEVNQLENYRKLVEAIYLKSEAKDADVFCVFTQSMVDSLSSMRNVFGKSAAYYYWMKEFAINPQISKQAKLVQTQYRDYWIEYVQTDDSRDWLLDSCIKIAPNWTKILFMQLDKMSVAECHESDGLKISQLLSYDSLNADYWYLLSKFYAKKKPFNLILWYESLLKSIEISPNPESLCELFNLEVARSNYPLYNFEDSPNALRSLAYWLRSEALNKHFKYNTVIRDYGIITNAVRKLISIENNDEVWLKDIDKLIFYYLEYSDANGKLAEAIEVLREISRWEHFADNTVAIISAYFESAEENSPFVHEINEAFNRKLKNNSRLFTDSSANFIAWRLRFTAHVFALQKFNAAQIRELQKFNSRESEDDLLWFFAEEFAYNDKSTIEISFLDSMLSSIHESPNPTKFGRYIKLLEAKKLKSRIADLHGDSCFTSYEFTATNYDLHNRVRAHFYCFYEDTISLKSLLQECIVRRDTMAFYQIIEVINPDCLFELKPEEIFGDTSYYVLNRLIRANQLKCAQQFFDHLESQTVNENIYIDMFKDDENIIELFLAKNDFGKAAELLELLIAKQYSSNGYASSDIKLPRSTNYDAFTQSKEYKAMMARVYTVPEK